MQKLKLVFDGVPVPKERPRFSTGGYFSRSRGGRVHVHTSKRTVMFEKQLAVWAKVAMMEQAFTKISKPHGIRVKIESRFSIPKSWKKADREAAARGEIPHVNRPDADNLTKSVLDGLNDIVWEDDSQVCEIFCRKTYTSENPCTVVEVEIIER